MKVQSKTAGKLLTYGLLGGLILGLTQSVLAQQSTVSRSPEATKGPSENFSGTVWATSLVPHDSMFTTLVGKVVFEPGARSNWHSHPARQLLIVTDGVGYHQIKGEPK